MTYRPKDYFDSNGNFVVISDTSYLATPGVTETPEQRAVREKLRAGLVDRLRLEHKNKVDAKSGSGEPFRRFLPGGCDY